VPFAKQNFVAIELAKKRLAHKIAQIKNALKNNCLKNVLYAKQSFDILLLRKRCIALTGVSKSAAAHLELDWHRQRQP